MWRANFGRIDIRESDLALADVFGRISRNRCIYVSRSVGAEGGELDMPKATLTKMQDYRYGQLFSMAAGNGASDLKADAEAWQGLCEEWPELSNYNGARVETRETLPCIPVRVGGELKSHLAFVRKAGADSLTLCLKQWARKSTDPFSAKYDCEECREKQEAQS
jgi:hypothetical protein